MINYTWNITGLSKKEAPVNGMADVVSEIEWTCTGVDEDSVEFTSSGRCVISQPDSDNFVEYASLTESDVIGWIPEHIIYDVQESIEKQIEIMKNQSVPVNSENLPWIGV